MNLDTPLFVASGIKEPWTRLIIEDTQVPRSTWAQAIKIREVINLYPDLINDKDPAFYVGGDGIALPLSYISTFPDRKPEIVYLGPAISLEFLQQRSCLKRTREEITGDRIYYCRDGVKRYGQEIR
jgi:hypothetical protein